MAVQLVGEEAIAVHADAPGAERKTAGQVGHDIFDLVIAILAVGHDDRGNFALTHIGHGRGTAFHRLFQLFQQFGIFAEHDFQIRIGKGGFGRRLPDGAAVFHEIANAFPDFGCAPVHAKRAITGGKRHDGDHQRQAGQKITYAMPIHG